MCYMDTVSWDTTPTQIFWKSERNTAKHLKDWLRASKIGELKATSNNDWKVQIDVELYFESETTLGCWRKI